MASERQKDNLISPWYGEHVYRYSASLNYITNNDTVLDLACGNGFGTNLISEKAKKVYGLDLDKETVDLCKDKYSSGNLHFKEGDATNLSFDDNYFNVILSFETIEHIDNYELVFKEYSRVLKNNGIVIFSTPNRPINSPNGVKNPFHIREWNKSELINDLSKHFNIKAFYGQEYNRYPKKKIGYYFEKFLLLRGIRKVPYKLRNKFFKLLFKKELYPTSFDFRLNSERPEDFKTFIVICEKKN